MSLWDVHGDVSLHSVRPSIHAVVSFIRDAGAPVRLVHGQLSEQLRAALDRKMKSTPPHLLPPGAVSGRLSTPQSNTASGPGSGVLRHHGQQWWSMTLQALGREAVAAEVHEGRPGTSPTCALSNKLSLSERQHCQLILSAAPLLQGCNRT